MSGRDNSYLDDDAILHPADAAAAILIAPGERYVLQLRDDKRGIFFPATGAVSAARLILLMEAPRPA